MEDHSKLISASLVRIRMKSPFFATLSLFAQFIPTNCLSTAGTDGKDVYFNPHFLRSLSPDQLDGLLLHEVLHAALLHPSRRGSREPERWTCAADIVVNGIILQQNGFELPPNGLREPQLEHLSVEEVYELLLSRAEPPTCPNLDLLSKPPQDCQKDEPQETSPPMDSHSDALFTARKASLEAHWRNALLQATTIARTIGQGRLPVGIERELGLLTQPQLDWRSHLWRYLVKTPTDYSDFDRRFVGQGLYLETLLGESITVYVAVDTSGSIDNQLLQLFLSEVKGILSSYPHLQGELYYADAELYGPYTVDSNSSIPQPKGGGGTSFVPFFEAVSDRPEQHTQALCIYLTDGYGTFPHKTPEKPVLWVITPGGIDLQQLPFGEAVRLLPAL